MSAKRVLVVDADRDVRELVGECLQEQCSVTLAADGTEALEAITREPQAFDAVVVDLEIPSMDGTTLIEELRHRDIQLPVLVLSGMPEAPSRARRIHVDYLGKPFDPVHLKHMVDQLLRT
jgi:CheY-like chemotaxis protein